MIKKFLSAAAAFAAAAVLMICGACISSAAVTEGGLAWSYEFSGSQMGGVASSPVVSGDYVYITAGSGLYRFNTDDGKLDKKVSLSGSIGYSKLPPTVAGGRIFVAMNGGKLDIFSESDMSYETTVEYVDYENGQKGTQSLTPVVYDEATGSIYLGSWQGGNRDNAGGGTFVRVDLDDYKVTVIAKSDAGFYWSGACIYGNYVIFGSDSSGTDSFATADGDAVLYAYDKRTGTDGGEAIVLTETLKDSGSICSTPVVYEGACYFSSKNGKLYEVSVSESAESASDTYEAEVAKEVSAAGNGGSIECTVKFDFSAASAGTTSTCSPLIAEENGTAYAYLGGANKTGGVICKLNLAAGNLKTSYTTKAETKTLAMDKNTGRIYATYNKPPGGIYVIDPASGAGSEYFVPDTKMQQYCISAIALDAEGTLYYANDSNYLMAVKERAAAAKMRLAALGMPSSAAVKLYGYDDVNVTWPKASGASGYYVEYKKSTDKNYSAPAATAAASYKKANLADGAKYTFRIRPYVTVGGVKYANSSYVTSSGIYTLKKTAISKVGKSSGKYVKVSWKNIAGESGYQIAKSKYKNKGFSVAKTVSSGYSSAKLKVTKGKKYYYKVRAYKRVDGKKICAPWSAGKAYKLK